MNEKFHYIDSIRGVAILMVILVHTAQSVKLESVLLQHIASYGQMGVQLFFVASAYTLCHSWLKRDNEKNKIINFAIRRFFRIAPVYYVGIVLYFIVSILENIYRNGVLQPADQYSLINICVNVLFINGFFPSANNNIVPGGWSIGTEMCFYAIFPMIMYYVHKIPTTGKYSLLKYPIFGLLMSQIVLILLYLFTGRLVQNNNFIYFSIFSQMPVFWTGISFYLLNRQGEWPVRNLTGNAFLFIFFTLLSLLLWNMSLSYCFSLIPFVSGISFVFLVKVFELLPLAKLSLLQNIGRASYSMYIFHFLFAHKTAQLINNKFPIEEMLGGDLTLVLYYLSSILLTFWVAKFSERIIEYRFIIIGRDVIQRYNEFWVVPYVSEQGETHF